MTDVNPVYILAFGPHPDDVEIGAGGLLAKTAAQGKHNMIIDLTCSHLSTRGTPELRLEESQQAATILGVQRLNLGLDDLTLIADEHHRTTIARYIRQYRPEIILMPYHTDRHPDHEATYEIIKQAIFVAGLTKVELGGFVPYRPRVAAMYQIRDDCPVDVIITLDESDYQRKVDAFRSYTSQTDTNDRARTYFDGRSKVLGWKVGAAHGEGYILCESYVGLDGFDDLRTRAW